MENGAGNTKLGVLQEDTASLAQLETKLDDYIATVQEKLRDLVEETADSQCVGRKL